MTLERNCAGNWRKGADKAGAPIATGTIHGIDSTSANIAADGREVEKTKSQRTCTMITLAMTVEVDRAMISRMQKAAMDPDAGGSRNCSPSADLAQDVYAIVAHLQVAMV
jgi:hypothetical protein